MTADQFNALLARRLELTTKVLATKAGEYASSRDRLHNFQAAAAVLRCSPARACLSFATKHLVSIVDLIERHDRGESIDPAVIDEKFGDAVNYLVLLEACVLDNPRAS